MQTEFYKIITSNISGIGIDLFFKLANFSVDDKTFQCVILVARIDILPKIYSSFHTHTHTHTHIHTHTHTHAQTHTHVYMCVCECVCVLVLRLYKSEVTKRKGLYMKYFSTSCLSTVLTGSWILLVYIFHLWTLSAKLKYWKYLLNYSKSLSVCLCLCLCLSLSIYIYSHKSFTNTNLI